MELSLPLLTLIHSQLWPRYNSFCVTWEWSYEINPHTLNNSTSSIMLKGILSFLDMFPVLWYRLHLLTNFHASWNIVVQYNLYYNTFITKMLWFLTSGNKLKCYLLHHIAHIVILVHHNTICTIGVLPKNNSFNHVEIFFSLVEIEIQQ